MSVLVTVTMERRDDPDLDTRDLGHLLRKHPDRVQTFSAPVGEIHVFYPEVSPERTTAAMLLEVDAIELVRSRRFRGDADALDHYINDRPYAASSMVSVALGTVFRSAMAGSSASHPELAARALPLSLHLPAVPAKGPDGTALITRLFAPLGWEVDARALPLDPEHPEWGDSRYCSLTLVGMVRLDRALRQLYVLLPVLDDAKHYWVGDDEAEKLLRQGAGWLSEHPERELITRRYLAHQRSIIALAQESESTTSTPSRAEEAGSAAEAGQPASSTVPEVEDRAPLRTQRAETVIAVLREIGAHHIVDLGCGPGALLRRMQVDPFFTRVIGVDVSVRALDRAAQRLNLAEASDAQRERIALLHGSAVYRDERLTGADALVLMEVIEHIDAERLPALEDAVFGFARPGAVIVTTPNREHNALYAGLGAGERRHDDHRFEWDRAEFRAWAQGVAARHGLRVAIRGIGEDHHEHGPASQLALFRRESA